MPKLRPSLFLLLAALLGAVLWLRWPSLSATLWNVDEGIHAAVARTLLDGGTLYRDAIDQRTPLTYYAVAGVFAAAGANNLFAVRLVLAGLIALTAFGLFLVGNRTRDSATGLWASAVFVALSTNLLPGSDAFAFHTEWFAILFTTWAAWIFWRRQYPLSMRAAAGTGALLALAFLSKQPALLDFAPPVAVCLWRALAGDWRASDAARSLAGLACGFAAPVLLALAYFGAAGALGDLSFYAWSYNIDTYGPEISALDRSLSALLPFRLLAHEYPAVLVAGLAAAALALLRLVQLRPTPEERSDNCWRVFLLVWCASSLAGAASGGRGFEHYAIQCLPAFSLAAGLALAGLGAWARAQWLESHRLPACAAAAALALVAGQLGWHAAGARLAALPPVDPADRVSTYVRERTTPADTLFVWGYNPDIYLYADRRPASRFVYCSFLTGLIPWTNLDPQKDTTYAIVPGAMDTLLAELQSHRPPFIVDCSAGTHRNFAKYPVSKFAALEQLLERDYAVVEAGRFVPQGFRLHLLRDRARRTPLPLAGGPAVAAPSAPQLFGRGAVEPKPTPYLVACTATDGRLQRLELLVDGAVVDGVSVAPCADLQVALIAPFERLGAGVHRLCARATRADGSTTTSEESPVDCSTNALPADRLAGFRIPMVTAAVEPLSVSAPFGPSAQLEDDSMIYFAHARSELVYPLDGHARRLRGGFGLRPAAFAASNPAATDGASFRIALLSPDGARTVLLDRLICPRDVEADRPVQRFALLLPRHPAGSRLEFTIGPGPADNAACDWTFWSDLSIDCNK
jgi:hypothetical protein